jgi:hypothetical protein
MLTVGLAAVRACAPGPDGRFALNRVPLLVATLVLFRRIKFWSPEAG